MRPRLYSRPCLPSRAGSTVTAIVGGVPVGSGHPDRRPVDDQHRHGRRARPRCAQVAGAGPGRQRAGAGHGQQRGRRRRRSRGSSRGWTGSGVTVPIIGDFHYNGHLLLTRYPDCARALAKYRINPGNVGGKRHDENFRAIIEVALANDKPVRIGVNWGSLDQSLLTEMMDANARRPIPRDARRRDHGGDGRERAPVRGAGRGRRDAARPDHPQRQGVRRAGPGGRLPHAGGPLRLPAAPRAHRGGPRRQGHHRQHRGAQHPAAGGHRRHHPRLADAGARRRPHRGGAGRAAGAPVARAPELHAAGDQLPRLRPHHQHVLPGDGAADPGLPAGEDAGVAAGAARASRR